MNAICSPYKYESARQYLLDAVNSAQKTEASLSLRTLATRMDISHSLLLLLLQNKRPLRVKHAAAVAKGLKLSSQERLYLQALIQFESSRDLEEKTLCRMWLSDLRPSREFTSTQLDQFAMVSEWYYMAILALSVAQPIQSSKDICKHLRGQITLNEAEAAVQRLLSMGMLKRKDNATLSPTYKSLNTENDVLDKGAQKYHKAVADLAKEAIEHVPLNKREFQSMALPVPNSKVALAKEMIRKFRSELAAAVQSDDTDCGSSDVFQFNIQFFQLTESPASAEDEGAAFNNSLSEKEIL